MTWRAFLAIALLAAVVGVPGAFFTIALPAQMRDGGASLFQIGFVWIIWLPSALKWLWAPWLEGLALTAGRRSWAIWLCTMLLGIGFLAVAPLAARMNLPLLVVLAACCAAISLSLQLLYNGWIMRNLNEAARGRANGMAAAGLVLGGILGGGVLPWAVSAVGWWAVVAPIAAAMALSGASGALLRDQGHAEPPATRHHVGQSWHVLRKPVLLGCIALIGLSSGADMTLPARLVDAGLSPEHTGLILGSLALTLMMPASLLAGWAAARWSLGRCFLGIALAKAAVLFSLALSPVEATQMVVLLSVGDFVLAGALTVLVWQFYMQHSDGPTPVARYAILTSVDAILRFIAGPAAGILADKVGYGPLFAGAAMLIAGTGFLVARMVRI